jgi:hypothetical protein
MQTMSKKLAITLIVTAFVVGAIGGGWSVGYIFNHITMRLIYMSETANAGTDVALLNRIRSNNVTNAVDVLETKLDTSVGMLGFYFKDIPESERVEVSKTLQEVKAYRDKFPHTNDYPEINQAISNAFLLVETNK